jgi:hypothetical protein
MPNESVMEFLRLAHSNENLSEKVRSSDSYEAVATLASQSGREIAASNLQAAFVERNGRALALQLIRRGLMPPVDLPPLQPRREDLWEAVQGLDLIAVVKQMVNRKFWSPERTVSAVRRYRGFLYLSLAGYDCAPTAEVDEIWHQHILNTQQYFADCHRLSGGYIHHYPSSGDNERESGRLADLFTQTWAAYESEFQEPWAETIGAALLQRWPNTQAA